MLFGSDANDLGGQFTNSANLYSYNVLDGTVTFLYGPTPTHHDYQISASYDGRYVSFTTSDGVYGYITGRDVFMLDQGPAAIKTADQIFADAGGKTLFLAELANASYHLGALELPETGYNNSPSKLADDNYSTLGVSLTWLNANISELSGLAPSPTGDHHTGLSVDGIYTNGNAAALVGRSTDALFIAFRGTNDFTGLLDAAAAELGLGTPDVDDMFSSSPFDEGMDNYYALLQPLLTALDSYIAKSGISHIFVTGHSLGAAMVQRYMQGHPNDTRFEAITFASMGYEFHSDFSDPRITNMRITGDVIETFPVAFFPQTYGNGGDTYVIRHPDIVNENPAIAPVNSTDLHSMDLYEEVAHLLSSQGDLLPLERGAIATTGTALVNLSRDIFGWHAAFPTGVLQGTANNDLLIAGPRPPDAPFGFLGDHLFGLGGDDWLKGNDGDDIFDGGTGINTALYNGSPSDYRWSQNADGSWTIADMRPTSPDGTDTLTHVQFLQFATGEKESLRPAPPSITSFSPDSGVVGDGLTNSTTVMVSGTADPFSAVEIYEGSQLLIFGCLADAGGNWTTTIPIVLSGGAHALTANQIDVAGHASAFSAAFTITVDPVAPVPVITREVLSGGGHAVLSGTSDTNSIISVFDNGALLGSAKTGNDGAWTFTTGRESNNVHTFTTTAVDLAGNVGASSNDAILGTTRADVLTGTSGNDVIIGRGGGDTIIGGPGSDTLMGSGGGDHFRYNAPADGMDYIRGFGSADVFEFSHLAFGDGLARRAANTGTLDPSHFVANATGPKNAAQEFWYNTTSDVLYYDPDGSGAHSPTAIAVLQNGFSLHYTDILLI
ncbi:hypothetical protein XI03_02715 [Bradyrhizobium sp. CCBAU 65884]|nr:hypothetical protein [Bradyrhizobium sp. CCBAU 65884]